MPTPLPSVPLAVPRLAVGAFAALLVLIASASSGASLAHADEPATTTSSLVTVSCTSASELMNTGYDSDADGRAPVGSVDPRWTVASGDVDALTGFSAPSGTTPPTLVMPPPPGAVFLPAYVRDPGPWSAPDSTRAQWISAATADPNQTSARGDFFYRYRFVLDPTVDPSSFAVDVTWLVDNAVSGAWVNGILQTRVGSPGPDGDPYDEPGYLRPYSARLAGSWQTGENTIDVQVKSSGLLEGSPRGGHPRPAAPPSRRHPRPLPSPRHRLQPLPLPQTRRTPPFRPPACRRPLQPRARPRRRPSPRRAREGMPRASPAQSSPSPRVSDSRCGVAAPSREAPLGARRMPGVGGTCQTGSVITDLPFESIYRHGFARVAACTIPVAIADPATNAESVLSSARACDAEGVAVAVFPELSLTGYAIDDLVMQDPLLDAVEAAVRRLVEASAELLPVLMVGAPLRHGNRLFNCAVVIHRGRVLGVVPKAYLPTYREFYEQRWYARGDDQAGQHIRVAGETVPFGPDLLFDAVDVPGLTLHAEVCEDVWVPVPPSSGAALAGATVLANLSGSPITIGRADDRNLLSQSQSLRCLAAYVYAAAGQGESTNDVSWDGQTMIYEGGQLLATTERFPDGPRRSVADVDLDRLRQDRIRQGTFDDNRRTTAPAFRTVSFALTPPAVDLGLRRSLDRFPFVPDDPARLAQDCYEAFNIQVSGLVQRLEAIGNPKPVLGVSGGLDSTHALLVIARAMDRMGRPRSDILTYTLPGFATSEKTKRNAIALAEAVGASIEEIDIRPAASEMLARMGHPFAAGEPVHDVTFENVQAGLRTDYLFRLANKNGGIVVGTGDLSEIALGWSTYGVGDQMSHYSVNPGVPKTLIQHVIRWVISSGELSRETIAVLQAVLDTEISPELVPAGQDGRMQSTEDRIGPYNLHDFTLYHVLRFGFRPSKIAFLAAHAWADPDAGTWPPGYPEGERPSYDLVTVAKWLEVFLQRFFGFAQFKRSAIPNGPKVSPAGSLSPRGDWRAPSDGNARVWLADLHAAVPQAFRD